MSKQLELAQATYFAKKAMIENEMLRRADVVLGLAKGHGSFADMLKCNFHGQKAFNLIFNDGCFDPWFEASDTLDRAYNTCVEDLGNEEDEVLWISQTWRAVLSHADAVKYKPIIDKLLDIEVNGL